jgi:hypothetical protein
LEIFPSRFNIPSLVAISLPYLHISAVSTAANLPPAAAWAVGHLGRSTTPASHSARTNKKPRLSTDRETKKVTGAAGTNNAYKKKAAAPSGTVKKDASSSLNAGVKRPIEEVGKVATASAANKALIGDVRNPMPNSNAHKSAAPSMPARNGPSSSGGQKKSATSSVPASTTGQSLTSTTATVSTMKPLPSSGPSKSLSKPTVAAKALTKFVHPESHPMASVVSPQSGLPMLTTVT